MEVGTKSSVRFSTFSVNVKKTWSWFFPRNPPRSTNCPCAMQLCPSWRACNGTGDPDTNSESSFIIHFFRGAAMGLFESFWWRPFSTCSLHFSKYSPPKIDKHVIPAKKSNQWKNPNESPVTLSFQRSCYRVSWKTPDWDLSSLPITINSWHVAVALVPLLDAAMERAFPSQIPSVGTWHTSKNIPPKWVLPSTGRNGGNHGKSGIQQQKIIPSVA